MSPLDKLRTQLESVDQALECLGHALEGCGLLLPTTEEAVIASRAHINVEALPEHLRDPREVLKRGRRVEKEGLQWVTRTGGCQDAPIEGEFALAARNGGQLDDSLLARMHADRAAREKGKSE